MDVDELSKRSLNAYSQSMRLFENIKKKYDHPGNSIFRFRGNVSNSKILSQGVLDEDIVKIRKLSVTNQMQSLFTGVEEKLTKEMEELKTENSKLEERLLTLEHEHKMELELLNTLQDANRRLLRENTFYFNDSIKHRYLTLETDDLECQKNRMLQALSESKTIALNIISEMDQLNEQTHVLQKEREAMVLQASHSCAQLKDLHNKCKDLDLLKEEQLQRRLILHRLRQRDGHIRVFLRTRTTNANSCVAFLSTDRILLQGHSAKKGKDKGGSVYRLHQVFKPTDFNCDLLNELKIHIISSLDGFNSAIIAYGQTGSGKTRTMLGTPDEEGVLEYLGKQLLKEKEDRTNWSYCISISLLEVTHEKIIDILSPTKELVQLNDDGQRLFLGQQIAESVIEREEDITNTLSAIPDLRTVGRSTKLNEGSHRRHLIVVVRVRGQDKTDDNCVTDGTVMLCDLAGFEDVNDLIGNKRSEVKEAFDINGTHKALADVFKAIRKKKHRIPFGRSPVTTLLKPCLVGEATCCLILHSYTDVNDRRSIAKTLQFGVNAITKTENTKKKEKKRVGWLL